MSWAAFPPQELSPGAFGGSLLFDHCCVNVAPGCFFCSQGSLECFAVPIIDSVNALSVLRSAAVS